MSPKLFIATPTQDQSVHAAYAFSLMHSLLELPHQGVAFHLSEHMYDGDLVRVRSRYVQDFLETDATHLLFLDADVDWSPQCILGMLEGGEDFVSAPYRRKLQEVSQVRVPLRTGERTGLGSVTPIAYPVRAAKDVGSRGDLHEVHGTGLGCTLLSRECLSVMVERYGRELLFHDVPGPGRPARATIALFQLLIDRNETGDLVVKDLLSEDLSFCKRWRDVGGQIYLYLGEGSPVAHHGSHRYVGQKEDFAP